MVTTQMFVTARYTWNDGSRVCLNVRSIKKNGKSDDYRVCLFANGQHTCSCESFKFSKDRTCKHITTQLEANERQHTANILATPETVDLFSLSQEELAARRITGEKKQKQLKREYQARTVAQQQADREAAVLQPKAFSILRAS